jgi:hypothetical protein
VATVKENALTDLRNNGQNPNVALQILNSRDNADVFGQPNVHRVIVGGTIAESGISTIGIAQFIDPGNFGNEDSALVLLDIMSNPSGAASAEHVHHSREPEDPVPGSRDRQRGSAPRWATCWAATTPTRSMRSPT